MRAVVVSGLLFAVCVSQAVGQEEAEPESADRPTLRVVIIHGNAVEEPRVITTPPHAAGCFWAFTYNLYSEEFSGLRPVSSPHVTLSFVKKEEWAALEDKTRPRPLVDRARFHTRVFLTTASSLPIVFSRKAFGEGPFEARSRLHPLGEAYLASHGIPTRRDASGQPMVTGIDKALIGQLQEFVSRGRLKCPLPELTTGK